MTSEPILLVLDQNLVESGLIDEDQIRDNWGIGPGQSLLVGGANIEEFERLSRTPANSIWAVGGGSTLDLAKLAGWANCDERRIEFILTDSDSPYRYIPDGPPRVPVRAVATTFSTGAERNSKASLRIDDCRLSMFAGKSLRPVRSAVLRSAMRSLPQSLVARGIAEVLFRLLGPSLESDSSRRDEQIVALLREVLEVVDAFARGDIAFGSRQRDLALLRLSEVGGELHRPGMFDISTPYVGIPWFLGRTVQECCPSVSKMDALMDAWIRLAHLFETSTSNENYLNRWGQIREAYNSLSNPSTQPLSGSLVHFLFTVSSRLFIDSSLLAGYGLSTFDIPARFQQRWSGVLGGDRVPIGSLSQIYAIPLKNIQLHGGTHD